MTSLYSVINPYESRNNNKVINKNKNIKKVSKTSKLQIQEIDENIKQPKNLRLNKFLTRLTINEGKKNYKIELIRFNKFWKEKNSYAEGPFLSSRTITGKNEKGNNLIKIKNNSFLDVISKQPINKLKNGNSVEENNNIKGKKAMSSEKMNKFYEDQKLWAKYINDKRNNLRQKIIQRNENELNQYFYPQTNRYYNITKYSHERTLEQIYQQCELDSIKQKYKHNQYTYYYKPAINYKKYKNISPKYNKYINKININKFIQKRKNNAVHDKNNRNPIKKSNIKKFTSNSWDKNYYNKNKNQKQDKDEQKRLNILLSKINNKKKINKNNLYYLNVNETTSCETFVNRIFYKRHNSFIEEMVLDKYKIPKKLK